MELHIKNFKYTEDKKFKFDNKFYLLKGVSGSGKSTVLEAIKFTLFGGLRKIKPLHNKKKLSVNLKYQDLDITRSKNPEQLLLIKNGKEYLNQEAQHLINQKFYTENIWQLSSYIPQKRRNIFLESNSSDKLEILKELIFKENKDINQQLFDIIDELSKSLLDKVKKIDGSIEYILKDLTRIKDENQEYFKIYEEAKEIEDLDAKIENIKSKLVVYNKIMELKEKNIDPKEVEKELQNNFPKNINMILLGKWEEYLKYQEQFNNVDEEKFKGYILEDLLEERNKSKSNLRIEEKFQTKNIKSLIKKIKTKIQFLSLESKMKKINKLEKYINQLVNTKKDLDKRWFEMLEDINYDKVNFDKFTAQKIKENILVKNIKSYQCPACDVKLFLKDNQLKRDKISISNNDKQSYLELINGYNSLLDYKNEAENKIQVLKKDIPESVEDVELEIENDQLEESLRILYVYQEGIRNLKEIEGDIEGYNLYKKYLNLKEFKNYPYPIPDDFEKYYDRYLYLSRLYNEIKDIDFDSDFKDIEKLETFEKYQLAISRCSVIEVRENDLKTEEKNRKKYMESLDNIGKLNNIIRETENKFMELRIGEINSQLNEFLDLLFDDININISMFREVKGKEKNKPQVNLIINFEGIDYPDFDYFSHGQRDRISLALTITFNLILGSPLLMFDEVFSSIEENKREDCLKMIRKYTKDKILLNICHETIEGFYDQIIKFEV